jgi:hypothetical protein
MMMNAAPPFCPVMNGKRHTLRSPTAEPAVARIIPNLLPKLPLFSKLFMIRLQKYKNNLNFAAKLKAK